MTKHEIREVFIHSIAEQYKNHGEHIPPWLHIGDIEFEVEEQKPITKNDLVVDCISREDVLNCLKATELKKFDWIIDAREKISKLPSVTPQEPRWIPVSERLPEEDTDVLVTLKCGLIGIMQKKLADDDNGEPCYIWQDFEGEEHEVIAWMPLPKTYSEVEV